MSGGKNGLPREDTVESEPEREAAAFHPEVQPASWMRETRAIDTLSWISLLFCHLHSDAHWLVPIGVDSAISFTCPLRSASRAQGRVGLKGPMEDIWVACLLGEWCWHEIMLYSFFGFFAVLGFFGGVELRASHVQGRHFLGRYSVAWATPLVLFALVILEIGFHFLFRSAWTTILLFYASGYQLSLRWGKC
jgi:hypothetical protein